MTVPSDDLDPHRAGRARDLLLGRLEIVGVEVGHLGLRDLGDLRVGDGPDAVTPGATAPLSTPAAWRRSTGVGGVFRMNVNDRSSKTVISTGTIVPRWFSVCALYILQKSMIATPWGPSAVPTGGAGVACPAGIWILTTAATFFLAMLPARYARGLGTRLPSRRVLLSPSRLELGDLAELELDRGLPPEDVDQHLELELVLVDLDDLAGEVGERALVDPDRLAVLVLEAGLAPLRRDLLVTGDDQEELLDVAARTAATASSRRRRSR